MSRFLIVNADDFGQTAAITRGIRRAHDEGIVTSTSLMVRWPAAQYAAEHADGLDLGLHVDLAEWIYGDAVWQTIYARVDLSDQRAIEVEVAAQLAEFRRLTGRMPSHLDSHQHIHFDEPVRSVLLEVAEELGVPLRGVAPEIDFCGRFYGQSGRGELCANAISVESLIALIRALPDGVTELGCHPGEDGDPEARPMYIAERATELETLCDPRVQQAITEAGIQLCTFREFAGLSTLTASGTSS